jgi:c-di-GMP-binding flagellar brake protein YcgR
MMSATAALEDNHQNPYAITSALEILAILRSIQNQKALIQIHAKQPNTTFITTLLEIDADNGAIKLDTAREDIWNKRILTAEHISFEASANKIRIQFAATQVTACLQDNQPALLVAIPTELIRLQRRDHFRINTPVIKPVLCNVSIKTFAGNKAVNLPLENISCGGLSMFDDEQLLDHAQSTVYKDCVITLPDVGSISVTLQLTHALPQEMASGKIRHHLGCAFVNPPASAINLLQRYVGKLERELIAKERGFA